MQEYDQRYDQGVIPSEENQTGDEWRLGSGERRLFTERQVDWQEEARGWTGL